MSLLPTRSHWLACVLSMALAPVGPWLEAQAPPPATPPAAAAARPAPEAPLDAPARHAERTQADLQRVLDRLPPSAVAVLRLDPKLLDDPTWSRTRNCRLFWPPIPR